ncbi:MAG: trypsin-like peptidase domain-containing protein [Actinomycetota bacterium]|nr:trypsin-like peptidase domain-containing protein [Actinomycetota bacterium]
MPSRLIAVVALVAGVLGGLGAAALLRALDSDEEASTRTVLVTVPSDTPESDGTRLASVPLPRGRFDPAQIYARRARGVVTVYSFYEDESPFHAHASQGSGFVVSRSGHILTNAHVVTNAPSSPVRSAPSVFVEFEDGDRAAARIIGWDVYSDVGLLKIEPSAHPLAPVPLGDSARVLVGEPVAVIGSPFGNESSLSVGIVSATRRSISGLTSDYQLPGVIQTDAAINRGNSGGPLLDAAGRVIGINAQIRSDSGVNEGVGFAVPINTAKRVMRDLIARGRVRYAYVGVTTQDLTPAVARKLGYAAAYGAVISCVEDDSPAARAGLRGGRRNGFVLGREAVDDGDVIVAINDLPVRSGADVVEIVSERLRPGRSAAVTVVRGSERRRFSLRLTERPAEQGSCSR